MAFNADEHAASLIPPVLVAGGKEYVGRVLSLDEVITLLAGQPTGTAATRAANVRFIRRAVEMWFPAPWWARAFRYNPAWRAFVRLPEATQVAAFESFSLAQRIAAPATVQTTAPLSPTADTGASEANRARATIARASGG